MENKVYCKNCKWLQSFYFIIGIEDKIKIICEVDGIEKTLRLTEWILKAFDDLRFNCKYYKRKWWKFWIKEIK